MKYLKLAGLILVWSLFSCNQAEKSSSSKSTTDTINKGQPVALTNKPDSNNEKKEIQLLVRNVLAWGESKKVIDLIPELTDSKDSLCIGFDLDKLKSNLEILRSTDYFSAGFIDNYDQIILTLDKEMKNKQFAPYSTDELPPFNFANDVDPWCDCQDVPYDTPNAYGLVEVHAVKLNKQEGELYWTWGGLKPDNDKSWKEFRYKFRVKKEDDKWKVSYLEGFDLKESVKYYAAPKKQKK